MGKAGALSETREKAGEGGHSGWGWHSGGKNDPVSGCFLPGGAGIREGKKGAGVGVVESSSCLPASSSCQRARAAGGGGGGEPSTALSKSWCVFHCPCPPQSLE